MLEISNDVLIHSSTGVYGRHSPEFRAALSAHFQDKTSLRVRTPFGLFSLVLQSGRYLSLRSWRFHRQKSVYIGSLDDFPTFSPDLFLSRVLTLLGSA